MLKPDTATFMPRLAHQDDMERAFPLPVQETLDEGERKAFEYVTERSKRFFFSIPVNKGKEYRLTPFYRVLLQSPRVAELWAKGADLFQAAEQRGSFSNRARDLVQQALTPVLREQLGRPIEVPVVPIAYAIESGIAPAHIKAIWDGQLDELQDDDRQLVDYIQAVAWGSLTRRQFDNLAARMDVKAAVEYTSFVTYKIASLRTMDAVAGIEGVVPDAAGAEEFLQAHIDGLVADQDYGGGATWVSMSDRAPAKS